MFKRDEIKFVSLHNGLTEIEEALPRRAKEFVPEWFTHMPIKDKATDVGTIKRCPGLFDYFDQGYIIPAWCDMKFVYDKESDFWSCTLGSSDDFNVDIHTNQQFLNHVPAANVNGVKATFVFKLISPWFIITKPGWSVMQLPLYYHFNNEFSILPGVIDTDIYHQTNQQLVYFGDNKEIIIKRGEPLVQYIPFKREKTSLVIEERNDSNFRIIKKANDWINGKFENTSAYRQMQKSRDKDMLK